MTSNKLFSKLFLFSAILMALFTITTIEGCKKKEAAQIATCTDGIKNGNETGVDCGGTSCNACPTCSDGIKNGTETGIDCGGTCGACTDTSFCHNGIQDGNETGIDCGGNCKTMYPGRCICGR